MMALFSEGGQRRLDVIAKPGVLCVFDFDGTLAPIVPRPEQARMTLAVKRRLLELSEFAQVAIITGRSLADITKRIEFEPNYVVGNHGLEGIPGWEKKYASYEALCLDWEKTLLAAFGDKGRFDSGIMIENKKYSLSVHYRFARDQEKTVRQLMELFHTLSPLARVISGKCVFNLLPSDAAGKGAALEQLIKSSGAPSAIYVGDDETDEDAFALQNSNLMTVRIGWKGSSAAKYFLSQRGEIVLLLDDLLRRLRLLQSEQTAQQQSAYLVDTAKERQFFATKE